MAEQAAKARSPLPAGAWVDAALDAIAEGGLAAVAIEPLARGLGATKGSFYHHFANRDALIAAALARWEEAGTEEPIRHLDLIRDLRERLRVLAGITLRSRAAGMRDAALSASADHPLVAPVLHRVTTRRVGYIADVYVEMGWPPQRARRRAILLYSSYVGLFHYLRAARDDLDDAAMQAYVDELAAALVDDEPGDSPRM